VTRRKLTENGPRIAIPETIRCQSTKQLSHAVSESAGTCLADPELFFPERTDPDYATRVRAAKAACGDCAVRTQCLEWTLRREAEESGSAEGIAGGLTAAERDFEIRTRRAEAKIAQLAAQLAGVA
jgi:WhiB family redox-sensing transcriptional regulator